MCMYCCILSKNAPNSNSDGYAEDSVNIVSVNIYVHTRIYVCIYIHVCTYVYI